MTFAQAVGLYAAAWLLYGGVITVDAWLDGWKARRDLDQMATLDSRRWV